MTDNWSTHNSENIRRRIPKACNYCRQRKIKCDGDSPCVNCINHKIDCVYSKTIKKRKKNSIKKLSLQDLDKRINKLDSNFEHINKQLIKIMKILKKNELNELNEHNKETEEFDESNEDYDDDDEEEEEEEIDEEEDNDDDDYKFHGKLEINEKSPISPDGSVTDPNNIVTPPIANIPLEFNFNNQAFDLTLSNLENSESKLNYIYNELPIIQSQIENEMMF